MTITIPSGTSVRARWASATGCSSAIRKPVDEWGKLLGDVPAAGAILDRLLHRAEVIAINGRSHRLASCASEQAPSGQSGNKRTAGQRQPENRGG